MQSLWCPKGRVSALDSGPQGLGGLVRASARVPEPGLAYPQPPQGRDEPGGQEEPSLDPWRLGGWG